MTKEQLSDALLRALQGPVEEFASQPSPAAKEAATKRAKLEADREKLAKVLGEDSPGYGPAVEAIDSQLKSLKIDDRTQRKQNLQLVAEALIFVTNTLRIPVKLKDTGPARAPAATAAARATDGTASTKPRTRRSPEAMQREAAAVLRVLPGAGRAFISKGEIAEKVGFDPQSALLKLKREGDAQSNGVRGAGGGWRKAD